MVGKAKDRRPKIEIKTSALDRTLKIAGWVIVAMGWLLLLLSFFIKLPVHTNQQGEANGNPSLWILCLLSTLSTILYIGLIILSKFPHVFNYAVPITPQNADKQYAGAVRLIRVLGLLSVLVFTFVQFEMVLGKSKMIGWVIVLFTLTLFIILWLYIWKSMKND